MESTKSTVQPNKQQLQNRLKRIEGQVRGIHNMVEEDRYCVDILNQIAAVQSAMNKVSLALLEDHSHHCVANAIKENKGEEAIDELMAVMQKMIK
ncbi:metal-sensitive transcriptional regulator [Alkalicoccus chagannorensis]|uniref:metal-sensitive transcriptional regulator n=1 Tax=Alkalicoccus chagannorensis TaxID=427072 RepID=UPI00042416A4|nr:metal-sensitive transcriptional regulator [Alkalicoccus chagannorensis]